MSALLKPKSSVLFNDINPKQEVKSHKKGTIHYGIIRLVYWNINEVYAQVSMFDFWEQTVSTSDTNYDVSMSRYHQKLSVRKILGLAETKYGARTIYGDNGIDVIRNQ